MAEETNGGVEADPQDLVIVERGAIKQLLAAVINTLKASANLEQLNDVETTDPAKREKVQHQLTGAREGLIRGINHLIASVDELPSIKMRDAGEPKQG